MEKSGSLDEDRKWPVRLTDGTVLEVGEREYYAILELSRAMDAVARNELQNLSLVAIGVNGKEAHQSLRVFDVVGLDQLAKSLSRQAKYAARTSALTQGTSRIGTSFAEH